MKHSKFLVIIFALLLNLPLQAFASDDIDLTKIPPPPPTPNTFSYDIPVTASIDETQITVFFESVVGNATITIEDENHQIVYQCTIDTSTDNTAFIPVEYLDAGNYSILISYETTNLIGEFDVE